MASAAAVAHLEAIFSHSKIFDDDRSVGRVQQSVLNAPCGLPPGVPKHKD
jgi:hypothetical protein